MLALLLLAYQVFAKDVSKAHYEIKQVENCPEVGYYFRRDLAPNSLTPGPCFLCFCQNDGTAVCWQRDNRRCDVESYHRHHVGRRETRVRRSPLGLSDIFFRDAAREVFNKQSPEECKPFESSFSEDCPPADWCVGCTVCDCDANGRWDCHLLSFCPDKKGTKTVKKRKKPLRRSMMKIGNKIKPVSAPTKKPLPTSKKNVTKKSPVTKKPIHKKPLARKKPIKKKSPTNKKPIDKKSPATLKLVDQKSPANDKPVNKRQAKLTYAKKVNPKGVQPFKTLPKGKKQEPNKKSVKANGDNENDVNKKIAQSILKTVMGSVNKMVFDKLEANKKALRNIKNAYERSINDSKVIAMKNKNKKRKPRKKPVYKKTTMRPRRKHIRNKRGVPTGTLKTTPLTFDQLYQENITNSLTNIVVTTATENLTANDTFVINSTLHSTADIPNTTATNSEYYKYSMDNTLNSPTTIQTTKIDEINNTTEILGVPVNNGKSIHKTTFKNENNTKVMKDEDITNMVDNILRPEFDLRKWNPVKLYKDKGKHLKKEIFLAKNSDYLNPLIENDVTKPKVTRKDIERRVVKKNILKKLLNRTHSIPDKDGMTNSGNFEIPMTRYKLCDFQSILVQLLKEMNNKNRTVRVKPMRRRYKINVLKIMKRLIKKIFSRKNVLRNTKTNVDITKQHIIDIICKSMGPCKIKPGDKLRLKSKVKQLNAVTQNILRNIKTMKGLLHLVDIPEKYNEEVTRENSKFNDDVHKLNIILKGTYIKENNITNTEMIQIGYIKNHAQDFIKSFGKFAAILNEIIAILTVNSNDDKFDTYNKTGGNFTQNKYFPILKNLIMKYDLRQNTFLRRMHNLLISMANNSTTSHNASDKVSNDRGLNKTVEIEGISRRLIENLRKLNTLAQMLNSSRRKREARNEDTMEYMLLMMEYLLKQNHPLDDAPVHDGIDLLLETIKGAPDIKPIKKQVLENTPPRITTIHTVKPTASTIGHKNNSDSYRISKEDNEENKRSSSDDSKQNFLEQKIENEYMDIGVGRKNVGEHINIVSNKTGHNPDADNKQKVIESITEMFNEINKKEYVIENVTEPIIYSDYKKIEDLTEDNSNIDKAEKGGDFNNDRKYDVFTDDNLNIEIVGNLDVYRNDKKYEEPVDESQNVNKVRLDIYRDDRKYGEDMDEKMNIEHFKKPGLHRNDKKGEHVDENLTIDKIDNLGAFSNLEDRKYEVYTADNEDDIMPNETKLFDTTEANPCEVEETTAAAKFDAKTSLVNNIEKSSNAVTGGSKKSKLDWIEEAYDKEMKAFNDASNITTTIKATTSKPVKFAKHEDNVSDISKEVVNGYGKKTSKINPEEVMFKKQMEFLNSLDYGTERSDFDDPDSKDGPDSGDAFSTYFV